MTKDELIKTRKQFQNKGFADEDIDKRVQSMEIQRQIEQYLANGGKITKLEQGDRAWEYKPFSIHG